ncbi:phosphoesterase [Anaeromicrobium sediminis]|uniref:Phosphoesterase n=1 Tax=Anaeromicrobium sediminis TaxID=1478221 RepID=A0A267MI58_9FIRM|nr:phosphoesterase [Anaeromicrobium sediminis]PAB58555.1 phosphoesterase [Anaeromicrobium sediminis]
MIYIIGDTHFNHAKVIDYENRPFADVKAMNKTMIKNWNKTISNKDTIYHLGDFAWGNKRQIKKIVGKLNGYKVLIKGNHDRQYGNEWWHNVGFNDVIDGGVILDNFYLLSHEPMYINSHMPYVNIHGHIHGNKMEGEGYYNASVELHKYKPISFDYIKSLYTN